MVTSEQVDAKKNRLGDDQVLSVLDGMKTLVVAKGKKIVRVDLVKERPDDATLKSLLLGPSGNLRAPTIKVGTKIVVGFSEEALSEVLSV
ncbi:MAG: hypothetical protein KDA96_18080 [Planctomycetaceae bacterium]|nr:hypothetical protein [Planctomycetaceae bacterium]